MQEVTSVAVEQGEKQALGETTPRGHVFVIAPLGEQLKVIVLVQYAGRGSIQELPMLHI